jgi:DNA replication protein DnaC
MKINERIEQMTKTLRLGHIGKNYEAITRDAREDNASYLDYLKQLLEIECENREEDAKFRRIRLAKFPQNKYLEDLKDDYLPEDARKKLAMMKSLEFIDKGQNIILSGNPGTGKSHLAIGLGIKACMEGYSVLFTSIPSLLIQLKESRSEGLLRRFQNKFEKYDLVICDELGYISFDKEGAELLFTNLSLRTERKAIIITTNLSFDRWEEIFADPVLTAAMVDRLTHKALMINMNGNSYRMKETKELIESLKS